VLARQESSFFVAIAGIIPNGHTKERAGRENLRNYRTAIALSCQPYREGRGALQDLV
jgi:hypothetical protein